MRAAKIYLSINAAIWIVYSLIVAIAPEVFTQLIGVELNSDVFRIEIIAMYGGLQLALGVFSLLGALMDSMVMPNLVFWCTVLTGLASFRFIAMLIAGDPFTLHFGMDPQGYNAGVFWFFEFPFALFAWYLLKVNVVHLENKTHNY